MTRLRAVPEQIYEPMHPKRVEATSIAPHRMLIALSYRAVCFRKRRAALNGTFTVRKKSPMYRCFIKRINCAEIDRS
jgi:hypothetical protein